jgi:hypothetical protein
MLVEHAALEDRAPEERHIVNSAAPPELDPFFIAVLPTFGS